MHKTKKNFSTQWLKGLKDEEKDNFKQIVLSDTMVLGKLKEILEDYLEELEQKSLKLENYDTPSWTQLQADLIGSKRTLRKVIDILPL